MGKIIKFLTMTLLLSYLVLSCKRNTPFSSLTDGPVENKTVYTLGKVDSTLASFNFIKILSVYDSNQVRSVKYKIKIGIQRPQVIVAMTGDSKIIGLTISLKRENKLELMDIGIESTAISLLFLTPELMTLNFDSAYVVINYILKIPIFKSLKNYIKRKIFTTGLNRIGTDPEYRKIASRVIDNLKKNILRKQTKVNNGFDYFAVIINNSEKAELINSGFRYVSVYRRDFTEKNEESVKEVFAHLNSMQGISPWKFSIISTGMYPYHAVDENFPPEEKFIKSEYWFQGPGFNVPYSLPPSIPIDIDDPWGLTIMNYLIIPFNGILFGNLNMNDPQKMWLLVKAELSFSKLENSSKENFDKNLIDVIWAALRIIFPNSHSLAFMGFALNMLNLSSFKAFYFSANKIGKYTLLNSKIYVNPNNIIMRYYHKNCNGPQNWYKFEYSAFYPWHLVNSLPWQKTVNDNYGDAFFRINFTLKDTTNIKILIQSDDGSEIYLNSHYLGWLGGVICHQEGCINMSGMGCGINHQVGALKHLSQYLKNGNNILAVHVSNGKLNRMYFNFKIIK